MYDKSQTKQPSKTNTKQAHLTARNVSPAYRNPSPANLIQLAVYDPTLLSHQDSVMLQRTIGNQAVGRLLEAHEASKSGDIQQTVNKPEETEKNRPLTNRTGLPDNLNAGVKNLSGDSPNAVRAPYISNSFLNTGIDVIQRVLIDGENITKGTTLEKIRIALKWGRFMGIQVKLTLQQMKSLVAELNGREDCEEILDNLNDKIRNEESVEEEKEGMEEKKEDVEEEKEDEEAPDEFFQTESEIQAARKKAAEDFGWKDFPTIFRGLKKIGVHETKSENVDSLVSNGPSIAKMDTGHHLGKGRGFYVTNVGKKELYTAIKDMNYGEKFVAVYVPITLQEIKSPDPESDKTEILDQTHGKELCYYLMSGGGEIVIPERCFHLVKVVSLKKQLFEYDRKSKIRYMKDGRLKTARGKTIIPARKVGGRRIKYPRKYFR